MAPLSIVISAYNEEGNLPIVLKPLVGWASEIIVVNNSSEDKSAEVARSMGAKVFTQPNHAMLNINKNYGFSQAASPWILNLDGDEELTAELKREIDRVLRHDDGSVNGYTIPRRNIIFGKWIRHGLWWPDRQLRLFRKGTGKFSCRHVHEKLEVEGPVQELSEPFIHHNYRTISQFIRKLDRIYTESETDQLEVAGHVLNWRDAIRFPVSDFLKVYFLERGYRDGLHGLVLAILQSFYAFIVFCKLWERRGFPDIPVESGVFDHEVRSSSRGFRYWQLTRNIEDSRDPLRRLVDRIQRKFFRPRREY